MQRVLFGSEHSHRCVRDGHFAYNSGGGAEEKETGGKLMGIFSANIVPARRPSALKPFSSANEFAIISGRGTCVKQQPVSFIWRITF